MARILLKATLSVCLWLTDFCNLDCKYCYAKPFSGRKMDSDRVLSLVDELIDLDVFDITLAGGEPTLHPKILEIIDRCVSAGMRIGLLTNGVALSEDFIEQLDRSVTSKNFIIQVSIDSIDPKINDVARGKTTGVLDNIRRLCETDLDIQLASVIHKFNVDSAHLIIDEFYPRIKRFHFLNIQRTESALQHEELLLDEIEAHEFWMRLAEYSKKFPEDLFLPSLRIQLRAMGTADVDPEHSFHNTASFDCGVCSAGWTQANITSDFDVLGCDIAKYHSLMGNCSTDSFKTVWNSDLADSLRNKSYPGCYNIKGPDGVRLADSLKPEYAKSRSAEDLQDTSEQPISFHPR